jgi:hypothetical protein
LSGVSGALALPVFSLGSANWQESRSQVEMPILGRIHSCSAAHTPIKITRKRIVFINYKSDSFINLRKGGRVIHPVPFCLNGRLYGLMLYHYNLIIFLNLSI